MARACGPRTHPSPAPYRVYLIRNKVTDEGYVGATKRSLFTRWDAHIYRSRDPHRKGQQSLISGAIRKYGRGGFEVKVLSEALNEAAAYQLERFWIRELRTFMPAGYNMTEGGRAGYRWSRKMRCRMRDIQIARMADPQNRRRLVEARTRLQRQRAELRGRRTKRWKALLNSRLKTFYGR